MYLVQGYGGSHIAIDLKGNAYTVGANNFAQGTAGAFQPNLPAPPNCQAVVSAGYPPPVANICYKADVAAVDPNGNLIYATFLGGSGSQVPAGIVVDQNSNVYVAGTTDSTDYPVTAGAVDPQFNATVAGDFPINTLPTYPVNAPQKVTGYVSGLNASGTALTFSTYFGGSVTDTITALAIDPGRQRLIISGYAQSPDLPGLPAATSRCVPALFTAGITLDGSTVIPAQVLAPWPVTAQPVGTAALAFNRVDAGDYDGNAYVLVGPSFYAENFDSPPAVACLAHSADMVITDEIVPGELLSILGTNLAPSTEATQPVNGFYPTSAAGVSITFNGSAAPVLYVSPEQINVQVPAEVADYASFSPYIDIEVEPTEPAPFDAPAPPETYASIAPIAPSYFEIPLSPGECPGQYAGQKKLLAINEDGTLNGCANPAPANSMVTLFVNGMGAAASVPTGAVNSSASHSTAYFGLQPVAGSISGVYSITATAPPGAFCINSASPVELTPPCYSFTGGYLSIYSAP